MYYMIYSSPLSLWLSVLPSEGNSRALPAAWTANLTRTIRFDTPQSAFKARSRLSQNMKTQIVMSDGEDYWDINPSFIESTQVSFGNG
jgi:hypothetical protein